ncbi:MAG TPA: POTRA domain-containing protein, partial [Polyangiaceae bacterium]
MRRPLPSLLAMLLAAGGAGCSSIPEGRSAVDAVSVGGARTLEGRDVEEKLATTESPKLLGLFRGVLYDYEVFDASILQRDLARLERYYRGHGFLEVHVRAAEVIPVSGNHVRVRIVVEEGPPTLVRKVTVQGLDDLPSPVATGARAAAAGALPAGARFDEDAFAKARTAVSRALTDESYAYARVRAEAQVDLATHSVDYAFTVEPGPPCVLGPITIVDVQDTSRREKTSTFAAPFEEPALRRNLHLLPGKPYSTAEIDASTQSLLDLEVLSSVQIVPGLTDPPSPVVPLTVKVQPAKLRELRLGGGFELDEIKTELHGLVSWEHHDFLGDLRDFRVEFKPGVVLYPLRVNNIVSPTNPLPEERLRFQFKQPAFLEHRTTLFAQPEANVFPMLVAPNPELSQPVLGYGELKTTVGVERRFGKHVIVRAGQNVQVEYPFHYTSIALQEPVPTIVLSYPQ